MKTDQLGLGPGFPSPSPDTLGRDLQSLRLNLNEGAEKSEGERAPHFPQRPGQPDCAYYARTGYCAYASNCRFNHPLSKWNEASSLNRLEPVQTIRKKDDNQISKRTGLTEWKVVREKDGNELSESISLTKCKFYLMPSGCKYGEACRYGHFREKAEVESVDLNFLGLPIRPGETACPFYMRTGSCGFLSRCCFHHPDSVAEALCESPSVLQNGGCHESISGESQLPPLQANSNKSNSCLSSSSPTSFPRILLPHQIFRANPKHTHHQVLETLTHSPDALEHPSGPTLKISATKPIESVTELAQFKEYPERPGQPECPFFMRHGYCKFKLACKFHHPKTHLSRQPTCDLTPLSNQPICTFYSRFGSCKYGPACKFGH